MAAPTQSPPRLPGAPPSGGAASNAPASPVQLSRSAAARLPREDRDVSALSRQIVLLAPTVPLSLREEEEDAVAVCALSRAGAAE